MTSPSKKPILVLGGSTFMGKRLLQHLHSHPLYTTFYINRGRKYWNNHIKSFTNLHYYHGDREDHTEFTKLLLYISKKHNITPSNKWHCVIDFSAFKYTDVESVREGLDGLCELYVFVSTDSVYDVMGGEVVGEGGCEEYGEEIKEVEGERKERAKEREEYGYNKLKCEMYLRKVDRKKFPYISLVLPDVIGPYDDTGRYWSYLKWITKSPTHPVEIDKQGNSHKFSLVYSQDVASLMLNLITNSIKLSESDLCQSYNLACREHVTLKEFLELLSESVGKELVVKEVESAARSFYPSVDYGFLNVAKAQKVLGWNPTVLREAVQETTRFFVEEGGKYEEEEGYAEKKLRKKIKME